MTGVGWPSGPDELSDVEAVLWTAATTGRVATVPELGDWPAVLAAAEALHTSRLLPEFTLTLAADRGGVPDLVAATSIVVEGVARTSSLGVLTEATDILLGAPSLLPACAEALSDACLTRVAARDPNSAAIAGAALEVAVRLALGRWVPEFDVLGVLVRLRTTEPFAFARSAVRCLGAAYDEWRDDRLTTALRSLAGLQASVSPSVGSQTAARDMPASDDDVLRIAPAVAFELGQCALGAALASSDWRSALPPLREAHRMFTAAREDEDRPDARVMREVVGLLADHLGSPIDPAPPAQKAANLTQDVREHLAGYLGTPTHWRAPRIDAEVAWAQLARDLPTTLQDIESPSWYDAARIAERVLATYTASRCSTVLRAGDLSGVQSLLAPRIERGIGSRAALARHLADHISALEERSGDHTSARSELEAARSLLDRARAAAAEGAVPPKDNDAPGLNGAGQDLSSRFPRLVELLANKTDALARISAGDPDVVARIELALQDAQIAATSPRVDSLVFTEAFAACRTGLSGCADYHGDVKTAVDEMLDLILKFVRDRASRSRSRTPYLFRPDASEADLADDLQLFLAASPLSSYVHTEVRDIGGGRVDIALFYGRFTLVIELKQEDTDVSAEGMRSYLSQAAAYTGSDVTTGFLVVLDLRPKEVPPTDLRSSAFVVVANDSRLGRPRHVATFLVAGNRRHPSSLGPVTVGIAT